MSHKMLLFVFSLQALAIFGQPRQLQQLLLSDSAIFLNDRVCLQQLADIFLLNATARMVVRFQFSNRGPEINLSNLVVSRQ